LPGGGTITTRPRDERDLDDEQQQSRGGAGAAAECSIALRYNAPALGPIDLSCRLDAGTLTLNLTLPPGPGLDALRANVASLHSALSARSDRAIAISVLARHDPLNVFA